jgi:pyruvate/2-oxoglutarate dehydrogenase complex dihydrolipoamide acyltransferase (E2) component
MEYEIKVPQAGFSITEGTIVQWHKGVGQKVQEGETVVSIETDKVVVEIPAQCTGILIEIKYEVGETVPIGSVLGVIRGEGDEKVVPSEPLRDRMEKRQESLAAIPGIEGVEETIPPAGDISTPEKSGRKISPLARTIAKREGVDLSQMSGALSKRKKSLPPKQEDHRKASGTRRRCSLRAGER